MKRRSCIGVLFGVCALALFGGCYEPLEITDRELEMVAEYAAGVLVDHGTQTKEALLDRAEQEESRKLSATPTPRPTPVVTVPPGKDERPGADVTKKPDATPVPDNTEHTMQELTGMMAKEDFYFNYTGYVTATVYQGAGELFAAADEGKQLVVLEFEVTNQSGKASTLLLNQGTSKELSYILRFGKHSVRPSLTLLLEDLYTSYEAEYAAGETKKGVLVFECPKEEADSVSLTVQKKTDGKDSSVLIKIK